MGSLERLKDGIFTALIFGAFGLGLFLISRLNYGTAVLIAGVIMSGLFFWEVKHVTTVSLVEIGFFFLGALISVSVAFISPVIFIFAFAALIFFKKFSIIFLSLFLGLGLGAGVDVLFSRAFSAFFFNLISATAFDTAAFYVGSALGGFKLAPSISPNKTWAGVGGGLLAFLVVAVGWHNYVGEFNSSFIFLPIFYVCGDLLKSQVKRCLGIKDFSSIFKSHGGIIDRVDSNLAGLILVNAAM